MAENSNGDAGSIPAVSHVELFTDPLGEIHVTLTPEGSPVDLPMTVYARFMATDEISTSWCASVPCVLHENRQWKHHFSNGPQTRQRVLELDEVKDESGRALSLPTDRVFVEPPSSDRWQGGVLASREKLRLEEAQDARFSVAITVPGTNRQKHTAFSAIMIADRVKLTVIHRVPGLSIIPMARSSVGVDVGEALNDVLPQLGYPVQMDLSAWQPLLQQRSPAAVIHAPSIIATTPEQAQRYVVELTHQLMELTALRRQARPRLLGGVLVQGDPGGADAELWPWVEGPGYSGNLLGGVISGEDPHSLITQWDGLQEDPRTRLWLSLFGDALSDERLDYRFFRCFNLLEGIATEIIPRGRQVTNDKGAPLLKPDMSPYTTDQARGKLYALIQVIARESNQSTASLASPKYSLGPGRQAVQSPGDLWQELDAWVKIRNDVAHRGSWRLPPGVKPDARRQRLDNAVRAHSHSGTVDDGLEAMTRTVRTAAETALYLALAGRLWCLPVHPV